MSETVAVTVTVAVAAAVAVTVAVAAFRHVTDDSQDGCRYTPTGKQRPRDAGAAKTDAMLVAPTSRRRW